MALLKHSPFSAAQFPEDVHARKLEKIVFVGSYQPRRCGIATFTHDSRHAMASTFPEIKCFVVAVNDIPEGYVYNRDEVRFEISENDASSYARASDYINVSGVSLVVIEHEYGLYGRDCGSLILPFMRQLRVPIVTVLHTILDDPSHDQRRIMNSILDRSTRVITMAQKGVDLLRDVFHANMSRIRVVPHGIPEFERPNRAKYKEAITMADHRVVLTFGLLSPNKGIEFAIRAMAPVARKFPDLRYIILGQTHPGIIRENGEAYRNSLIHLATECGIADNVVFIDRFVDLAVLQQYIAACDIYLTPYQSEKQITSGTLSYAFGMGSVVVSTPYWHAKELLADGRGFLVPFRDPAPMTDALVRLFDDDALRERVANAAFDYGRSMTWPMTAKNYFTVFNDALEHYGDMTEPETPATPTSATIAGFDAAMTRLPAINLQHLLRLTDDTSILQHAKFDVPDRRHGYCLDDAARALNLLTQLQRYGLEIDPRVKALSATFMAFTQHAFDFDTRRFRNFMSFSREWLDSGSGSEDAHGRALQALAACVRFGNSPECANELFLYAMNSTVRFNSLRAIAYSIVGLRDYVCGTGHIEARALLTTHANNLMRIFTVAANDAAWPWPERLCTYDNAVLPQALIVAGALLGDNAMRQLGFKVLQWLFEKQMDANGKFSPIGNNGWLGREGTRALFDQQSIEAGSMVMSCISAMHAGGDRTWYQRARIAFDWYVGRNALGKALYDPVTGGCYDALHQDRINKNQGAESLLMFLQGLATVKNAERELGEVDAKTGFK